MVKQQFCCTVRVARELRIPSFPGRLGKDFCLAQQFYCGLRAAAEMVRLGLYRAASSEGACLDIHSYMHP